MEEKIIRKFTVDMLPEGYMKDQMARLASYPGSLVTIIAKKGYAGDWAAYSGWPLPCKPVSGWEYYSDLFSTPDGVESNGDKMGEKDARIIFPEFKDLRYRP